MYKLVFLTFLMSCRHILGLEQADNKQHHISHIKYGKTVTISNLASINFYQVITTGNENALFCPLSLNILLALTTTAARGNTAEELRSTLLLDLNDKEIESHYNELLRVFKADKSVKIATRIFPRDGVYIWPAFVKTAEKFNSDIEEIDYKNRKNAAKIINTFVEKNTNNKIHDLVSANSFSAKTYLLLVNAVYFKEDWEHKFKYTFSGYFYLRKDKKVKTTMMSNTQEYQYTYIATLDAKVLEIPYKRNGYSMLIILPSEIDGLNDVEKKLGFLDFGELQKNLTKFNVKLTMPKFKMEKTLKLKEVCKELGITSMFLPDQADLSGLTNETLYVNDIIQKTYITVDEKGAEAAAATGIHYKTTRIFGGHLKDTIKFNADHPFIFVLMKNKIVLFLGRLCQI